MNVYSFTENMCKLCTAKNCICSNVLKQFAREIDLLWYRVNMLSRREEQ